LSSGGGGKQAPEGSINARGKAQGRFMVSFCVQGILSPSTGFYCAVCGYPAISAYRKGQAVGTAPVHLKRYKKRSQKVTFLGNFEK